MFCQKCWREIRNDSIYCSYCGIKVEETEEDASKDASSRDSHGAPCVVPGAPKKHCRECGKELPSSTISEICAMCTIRKRNRELDAERDRSDAASDARAEAHARVRRETADTHPVKKNVSQPTIYETSDYTTPDYKQPPKKKKSAGIGVVALVIIFFLLPMLFNLAELLDFTALFDSLSSGTAEASKSVSVSEEIMLDDSDWDTSLDAAMAESESLATLSDEDPFAAPPANRTDLFERFLRPAVQTTLNESLSDYEGVTYLDAYPDISTLTGNDGLLEVSGTVRCLTGTEETEIPFTCGVFLTQNYFLQVYLLLDGGSLFDNREMIDSQGYVTENGGEFYSVEPGTYLFEEDGLFLLDDYQ